MALALDMNHKYDKGFSMIEVLVALFVFAIGVLTVAGLQIVSKRANHEAVQRTTATYLAYDIIERMRANPRQLGTYVDDTLGADRSTPSPMCNASTCTATQLADYDVWEWQQAIKGVAEKAGTDNAGGLVNPVGCIAGIGAGGQGVYTVTIVWQGTAELTTSNTNTCGAENKTTDEYGTNNEYRRIIEISTYIAP